MVDESYEEKEEDVSAGVRGSVGDGGGDFASGDSPYMTLRSRKLPPGNWRSDNTFPMRNMHGMDALLLWTAFGASFALCLSMC